MSEHTPTPWALKFNDDNFGGGRYLTRVVDSREDTVHVLGFSLSSGDECEANSEFIVLACNSYDNLVKEVAHWKGLYEDEKRDHEATIKHAERERNEYFGMTFLEEG